MTNEHIKEMLLELEKTDIDFTVTMTGKESKKVNGLYKPTTHEILILFYRSFNSGYHFFFMQYKRKYIHACFRLHRHSYSSGNDRFSFLCL